MSAVGANSLQGSAQGGVPNTYKPMTLDELSKEIDGLSKQIAALSERLSAVNVEFARRVGMIRALNG